MKRNSRSLAEALSKTTAEETSAVRQRLNAPATAPVVDKFARADEAMGATGAGQGEKQPAASKVIRDTFSFPESDYARIAATKERALRLGVAINKGEALRVGLLALE
ncbi:MAG TPA: hypothetical protein VF719_03235, partial [Abditibacteriaceae bacterium]